MAIIQYLTEIDEDFKKIPERVKGEVNKYLEDLKKNPYFGKKLERELQGCYSLYLDKTRYRIVYKVEHNAIKIVLIIAVGERAESEVYKIARKRLDQYGL